MIVATTAMANSQVGAIRCKAGRFHGFAVGKALTIQILTWFEVI
jgi:hypothetical protein